MPLQLHLKKISWSPTRTPHRRADGGEHADEQADSAERPDGEPMLGQRGHPVLHEVHLHGQVDAERPEGECAEQPDHLVEVREQLNTA
jgi:hypothetical protein